MTPRSLPELRAWLDGAPPGTMVPAAALAEVLGAVANPAPAPAAGPAPVTWRERLWTVPPETRLGVAELAEAVGRARSWVYRHTSPKSGLPLLPCRRIDGELVFVAGEVRTWIENHEEIIVAPERPLRPAAHAPFRLHAKHRKAR